MYTQTELSQFIQINSGRNAKQERTKKTVWSVMYLGKQQYIGSYALCVHFKNQFKGQKDFKNYQIK